MTSNTKHLPITWGVKDEDEWFIGAFTVPTIPAGSNITYAYGGIEGVATANQIAHGINIDCELWQDTDVYEKEYTRDKTLFPNESASWFFVLEKEYIPSTAYKLKLKNPDGCLNDDFLPSTLPLSITIPVASITDISITGNRMYQDVVVDYNLPTGCISHYNIYMENNLIMAGVTENNQITIPSGTILEAGTLAVQLYASTEYLDDVYNSAVTTETITIQELSATRPTDLRLMGSNIIIEQDALFKWNSDINLAKLEIWQEGEIVLAVNKIQGKQYTLKGSTLTSTSSITVRVRSVIDYNGEYLESLYDEVSLTNLESIRPVIADFTLGGDNRDYNITITPTSTNCDSYKVKLGNNIISNTLTIPKDTLTTGTNRLTLIGYNNGITGTLTKDFTITQDEPIVYTIEPNNISVNVDMLSNITFTTNEFVDSFRLYINGNLFYSGTNEREIIVTNNTFIKGTNSIKVQCTYRTTRECEKEVTFIGYGRPDIPILNLQDMYDTATPTLQWESDEQIAFEIYVGEDEHSTVSDTATEYTIDEALTNNGTYAVKLRVKNSYELWSDWVEGVFQTLWADIDKPELILSQQGSNVLLQVSCLIEDFKEMDIYKYDHKNKSWIIYANDLSVTDNLTDYLVVPNKEEKYKARVYNTDGIYNESEIQTITVSNMKNYNIVNLLDLDNNKRLDFVSINFVPISNAVSKIFSGQSKPRIFKSKVFYYTANMTVKLENCEVEDFIQYIQNGKIFCYRDYKGKKLYVSIDIVAINYINPFMQEIVLKLTEVNFNEYLSGNKGESASFIYLNGQYYLDGTTDLRGWN